MLKKIFLSKSGTQKQIFMDYASGAPVDERVFNAMKPYFSEKFFNAGAIYSEGFAVREVIDKARAEIAQAISARPKEIIFTDGGTEANNLVVRGLVSRWKREHPIRKPHIIISSIEHASLLKTCQLLEEAGDISLDYLSVDENGVVDIKELKQLINEDTLLVSVMFVNGEIGVVQDIREIAKTIRHYRKYNKTALPYLHTDAIQAFSYFDVNVQKLGIDFLSLNASKVYGPKKMGLLYKKASIEIDPLVSGGMQEFGLRAGTEDTASIVGFAEAIKISAEMREQEYERVLALRALFEVFVRKHLPEDVVINGEVAERAPHIVNISIPQLSSEEIVLRLDAKGIKISEKSACASGAFEDSHVLRAMRNENTQSLRFSFGRDTTQRDVEYVVKELVKVYKGMQDTFDKYRR